MIQRRSPIWHLLNLLCPDYMTDPTVVGVTGGVAVSAAKLYLERVTLTGMEKSILFSRLQE